MLSEQRDNKYSVKNTVAVTKFSLDFFFGKKLKIKIYLLYKVECCSRKALESIQSITLECSSKSS